MTDRELLNYAAKAAGIPLVWHNFSKVPSVFKGLSSDEVWNPRTDSGQALELAVRLGISIDHDYIEVGMLTAGGMTDGEYEMGVQAWKVTEKATIIKCEELYGNDPLAATRLAITRAAAEIGKEMP